MVSLQCRQSEYARSMRRSETDNWQWQLLRYLFLLRSMLTNVKVHSVNGASSICSMFHPILNKHGADSWGSSWRKASSIVHTSWLTVFQASSSSRAEREWHNAIKGNRLRPPLFLIASTDWCAILRYSEEEPSQTNRPPSPLILCHAHTCINLAEFQPA